MTTSFSGFPRGTLFTPVPNPLFGPLLEQIQDLAELKVTLRGLWLLHRRRGRPNFVHLQDFLNDPALLRGLKGPGKDPKEEIHRGLGLAVARGTFLLHRPGDVIEVNQVYLLNNDAGQRALAQMRHGKGQETENGSGFSQQISEEISEDPGYEPPGEKPSIFTLYENNVGTLSPLLAEQLKEAEADYPWPWINEAFQIAVVENKRSWRYIAGILRRWAAEGKNAEGKDYGKPGRHSEKDNRQKYLEDYERRWGPSPRERSRR